MCHKSEQMVFEDLTNMAIWSLGVGLSCSFILLVLKEQLQELQAALIASIMDTEEYRKGYSSCSGPASPLEWTDGLQLLHSCPPPLDQHLLTLLGCTGVRLLYLLFLLSNPLHRFSESSIGSGEMSLSPSVHFRICH